MSPSSIDQSSLVVKSNQFIEASYNLPLNGHRLLSLIIAAIPKRANQFEQVTLNIKDIAKTIPALSSSKAVHKEFEKVVDELMEATITLRE